MADIAVLTRLPQIVEQVREGAAPDPAAYDLVLDGLELAGRVLGAPGPVLTIAELHACLNCVRALHLAGLNAVGPPGHQWH